MGGSKKTKETKPSYEDGHLRDPELEKLQDPKFRSSDLQKLIAKAAKGKAPEGA